MFPRVFKWTWKIELLPGVVNISAGIFLGLVGLYFPTSSAHECRVILSAVDEKKVRGAVVVLSLMYPLNLYMVLAGGRDPSKCDCLLKLLLLYCTDDMRRRTDNQEKDEKQSQNDKTGLGMEKTVKDKAKSKPESQFSQKVNRKVNWSKSKSTQVNPGAKVKEI
ncbi:hypothetical protein Tco_0857675 [Tanacetum coccineum]|uniref:PIN-like protein n=1 Tax=Tanacetum coccineum TaxID=301880 RepID=A0ABQ5B9Z2_9ASTR